MPISARRQICFVTGTRAEFGLMRTTLAAITAHQSLGLQVVATGMHLSRRHGYSLEQIRAEGFGPDATVAWSQSSRPSMADNARNTGRAIAGLAEVFARLRPEIVMVVGDRVEAFAAATAAHLAGIAVAHVHGGDRALGLVDDSLRHAITKLAHVHFAATAESAQRVRKLGEDAWRIHCVGTPGNDGIKRAAAAPSLIQRQFTGLRRHRFALLVLHPASSDDELEYSRAELVLNTTAGVGFDRLVVVYPNNDPGSGGIIRCWKEHAADEQVVFCPDLPRNVFLGLMRDAACVVGNSSGGIIEAASFGTPVVDIGPRQAGRQHSTNLVHCAYQAVAMGRLLAKLWDDGQPRRCKGKNVYGGDGAGRRMARILAALRLDQALLEKLISY